MTQTHGTRREDRPAEYNYMHVTEAANVAIAHFQKIIENIEAVKEMASVNSEDPQEIMKRVVSDELMDHVKMGHGQLMNIYAAAVEAERAANGLPTMDASHPPKGA